MKTESEIQSRIKDEILRLWKERVDLFSQRLPHHCIYNHRQELDFDKTREGEINPGYNRVDRKHLPMVPSIGICMHGSKGDWNGTICDDPVDAGCCPLFTSKFDTDSCYAEFVRDMQDPEWISANAPSIYSLLWVVNEDSVVVRGWVGSLLRFFFPHRPAPLVPPLPLLPPPELNG